jgi:hypothetical protein
MDATYSSSNMQRIVSELIVITRVYCIKWMDRFCTGELYFVIFSYWGSDEIGSCILKCIVMLPKKCNHLVICSDNYPGQNKNWNICTPWLYLVRSNYFECTEHFFMVAGHTHIASDRGFVKIEKFSKNRTQAVHDSDGWRQIVLQCNRRKPFHVTAQI